MTERDPARISKLTPTGTHRVSFAVAVRYRIERELGVGGMATVYLARDLKQDRDVALKILWPEVAEAIGADLFVREMRLVAELQHPNILPIWDHGSAYASLFYAMPYVQGETLRAKIKDDDTEIQKRKDALPTVFSTKVDPLEVFVFITKFVLMITLFFLVNILV